MMMMIPRYRFVLSFAALALSQHTSALVVRCEHFSGDGGQSACLVAAQAVAENYAYFDQKVYEGNFEGALAVISPQIIVVGNGGVHFGMEAGLAATAEAFGVDPIVRVDSSGMIYMPVNSKTVMVMGLQKWYTQAPNQPEVEHCNWADDLWLKKPTGVPLGWQNIFGHGEVRPCGE